MKRWTQSLQDNYGTPSIELVSGKGSLVKGADGTIYLDFLAGIATNVLGHAHPAIVKACLLYTSPSPRDRTRSRMPSSA